MSKTRKKLTILEIRYDNKTSHWECWQGSEFLTRSVSRTDVIRFVRFYCEGEVRDGAYGFEVRVKLKNSQKYSSRGWTFPRSADPKESKG